MKGLQRWKDSISYEMSTNTSTCSNIKCQAIGSEQIIYYLEAEERFGNCTD